MKTILSLRRRHYKQRLSIFLIVAALIAGMVGCSTRPAYSPIEIRNWYDLQAISGNLSADYILVNDLDRNTPGYTELASQTANGGKGWQPLGIPWPNFTGVFDGQGYEIRDFFINRPDEDRVGLFHQITLFGVIRNVGVVNATVIGNDEVGGLVGYNWKTVNNCYFSGNVTGKVHVGGLVGSNSNPATVSNSYSTGSVTGDKQVGGLVGDNWDGTVSNSYSTSNVTGDENFVGGLLGHSEGTVSDSYSTGSVSGNNYVGGLVGVLLGDSIVSDSYSTSSVSGNEYVGGLAGYSGNNTIVSNCHFSGNVTGGWLVGGLLGANDEDGTVSNSYSTGSVSGTQHVGGLVAWNEEGGTVINSYSTGSVTGDDNVGGLVGFNNHDGTVSNSYSTGTVSGNEDVGGLIGWNNLGTVSNSFWDTETSGQATSHGGTGKNTTEMQSIATFSGAGWDIVAVASLGTRIPSYIWNILSGVSYPFLSW